MTKERRNCEACPTGRTSGRLCAACVAAKNDTESPWDLGEGYWRTHKGVKVEWVPKFIPEPAPELEEGHIKCVACPTTFIPNRPIQTYCSRACRKRAGWAKRKAKVNQERREERARIRQELSVPCSTCNAAVGENCKSPSGTSQAPHVARLMAAGLRPRCKCGAALPPQRQKWCDTCKALARRDDRRAASERYRAKKNPGRPTTRGWCDTCGRFLHVRSDGTVRLHRDADKQTCPGSRRPGDVKQVVAA